jgi:hypothetical protein
VRIAVEGTGYRCAAQAFVDGNQHAARAGLDLSEALAGCTGMAGDDATASDFAASYDEAASAAVAVLEELVGSFASLARLSEASLRNHVAAEAASVLPASIARIIDPPSVAERSTVVHLPAPPSSLGSDGSSLPGWASVVLDILEGVFWPDADTERLRAAATTWRAASTAVGTLAGHCASAVGELTVEVSPEVPLAVATTEDLRARVESLSDQLGTLATACEEYAAQVDAKRAEMLDLLEQLGWELGIGATVSGALSFFTGGLAAPAAGTAGAARVGHASWRVRGILESLGVLSRGTAATIRPVSTALRDTRAYLARLSAARTERGSIYFGRTFRPHSLGPNWLARHRRAGGHLDERHVGWSDRQLLERLAADSSLKRASTFADDAAAERAVSDLLRRHRHALAEWLAGNRRTLTLEDNLGYSVGRTADRTGTISVVTGVRAFIVRDPALEEGFRIHTAFPVP